MAKSAIRYMCGMAQRQLSDYFYELATEIKAQYLEKTSLIKQEDPYVLKKAEFAVIRLICLLLGTDMYVNECSATQSRSVRHLTGNSFVIRLAPRYRCVPAAFN